MAPREVRRGEWEPEKREVVSLRMTGMREWLSTKRSCMSGHRGEARKSEEKEDEKWLGVSQRREKRTRRREKWKKGERIRAHGLVDDLLAEQLLDDILQGDDTEGATFKSRRLQREGVSLV
jgi:hypothetical protein